MADITLSADAAQSAMDAIGAAYFPLEKLIIASGDATMQQLNATLHAALAAGEKLVVGQSNGGVRPQDGGSGNKPPSN